MKRRRIASLSHDDNAKKIASVHYNNKNIAKETRFNDIPPEVLFIIIDFIPCRSQVMTRFILTSTLVYNSFRNHRHFAYYQFRSSIHSVLPNYFCTEMNTSDAIDELDELLVLIKAQRDKIQAISLLEPKRAIWKKWVLNDRSAAGLYPESSGLSLTQRQTVYDKFFSLVTFELVAVKVNEEEVNRIAKIHIGADILLTYEGIQGEENSANLDIVYGDDSPGYIWIGDTSSRPYDFMSDEDLQQFRDALGLTNIGDDDMIDLITFALPLPWKDIGPGLIPF